MADNTCPICLDTIGESNSCKTSCNHSFCLSCLHTSLLSKNSCPMCRKELVPKNDDRVEVDKLRENLGRMHMAMDGMQDNMYDLNNTISSLQHEVIHSKIQLDIKTTEAFIAKEESKKESSRSREFRRQVERWMLIVDEMSKGPCAICGCSSECDIFGDRICFCDSCQNSGCVNEENKWRRQWEDMSIDAIKDLGI